MNQLQAIQFVFANIAWESKYDGPILSLVASIACETKADQRWTADELQGLIDIEQEVHCEKLDYPPGE